MDNRLLEDFERLKFGDIIQAIRPGMKDENDPMGYHSDSQHIVVANNGDYLTCLKCTTAPGRFRVSIEGKYQALPKGGYINHYTPVKITKKDFLYSYNSSLNTLDKERIKKYIIQYHDNFDINDIEEIVRNDINLSEGDIVYYDDKLYLIIGSNEYAYMVLPIKSFDLLANDIGKAEYQDGYYQKQIIPKEGKMEYWGTLKRNKYEELNQKLINSNNDINNMSLERGYLLRYGDKYYYVYGINGDDAYCFESEYIPNSEKDTVKIGEDFYRINFDEPIIIDKNGQMKYFADLATSRQSEIITEKRKSHKRAVETLEHLRPFRERVQKGSIIGSRKTIGLRFFVNDIKGNEIDTVNLDSLLYQNNIRPKNFDVNDKSLYICKISKEELEKLKSVLTRQQRSMQKI